MRFSMAGGFERAIHLPRNALDSAMADANFAGD
jgi:hypothetical protein